MANIIIQQAELIYLREAVLKRYCRTIHENYEAFTSNLTGAIKYYDAIADVVSDYIEDEANLLAYMKLIEESPFKIMLRKRLEESEVRHRYKNMAGEPAVSGNIIRKLIFYGPMSTKLSFKDYFILACYIYISEDRTVVLNNPTIAAQVQIAPSQKQTVNPIDTTLPTSNEETIAPYKKRIKCSLSVIEGGSVGEKLEFDFTGHEIILNRATLDPNNLTITSKIQAKLNFIDNKWQITNQSELKTTFIQVNKPFTLEKGDVVVFGNRYFIFND